MTGQELYKILVAQGVERLYHANSVKTALSLLRLGGLASRQLVEQERLPQTIQYTDDVDRQFGIWGDIFADTVDIHARISDRNKYGPVLFVLSIEILNMLPLSSRALVTRSNPSKWGGTKSDTQRYFLNAVDLVDNFSIGNFDQMLVIRTSAGIVPFGDHLQSIILDEPRLANEVGQEFCDAANALTKSSGGQVEVVRRSCSSWCKCAMSYAEKSSRIPWFFNLP